MNSSTFSSSSKVAVILPAYNGEKFIAEQIDSILNQTFSVFELYIFDDGSTDGTIDIIDRHCKNDSRVKLVVNETRKGVIKNINDALTQVMADVYILADQDDVWLPEKISRQLEVLENPDVVLTFTNLELIDEIGNSMNADFWSSQIIDPSKAANSEVIAIKTMVTGCTMAFKRELLKIALPIPAEATMHDHWLSFFASVVGGVEPINETLVKYRQHSNNIIGAMKGPVEIREKRYEGCHSYSDYKIRKLQSYHELLTSLLSFQKRLVDHSIEHKAIDQYIAFYQCLVKRQWLKAFW